VGGENQVERGQQVNPDGRVGRRRAVETVRPGDRVFFEPHEDHWHGASPSRVMSPLSLVEADENGDSATWGEHVSDDEYGAAAADE
jgi:quercetin dioxygenase-like cupin family protein